MDNKNKGIVKDHLGQEFKSIRQMCIYWGVLRGTFDNRINKGWSLGEALMTPSQHSKLKGKNGKRCKDHLGNEYDTIGSMCDKYGISYDTYTSRIRYGWSLEEALTTDIGNSYRVYKISDHLGQEFNNITSMCDYWGIKRSLYYARKNSNWDMEKILTTPVNHKNT